MLLTTFRCPTFTCICIKILEHILVSNINKHLALDSILADCQLGFQSQRSCETELFQFVHDIISNLDGASFNNNCVRSISLLLFEIGIPNLVCECISGMVECLVSFTGHCDLDLWPSF